MRKGGDLELIYLVSLLAGSTQAYMHLETIQIHDKGGHGAQSCMYGISGIFMVADGGGIVGVISEDTLEILNSDGAFHLTH